FQSPEHFGDCEAKFRAISAGTLPASASTACQLDAHSDLWPNAHLLGILQNEAEFGVFFHNRNHLTADLLSQHRHFDKFGILEAVADDRCVVVSLCHNSE